MDNPRSNLYSDKPVPFELEGVGRLFRGAPGKKTSEGRFELEIPTIPHVFTADILQFNQQVMDIYRKVNIVIAHGVLIKKEERYCWCFANGYPVDSVVNGINTISSDQVDIVVACSGKYVEPQRSKDIYPLESDFREDRVVNLPNSVVYIMNENIRVRGTVIPGLEVININCDLNNIRCREILESKRDTYQWKEF